MNDCSYGWTEQEKNATCRTLNFINRNSNEKDLTVLTFKRHAIPEKRSAETPLITKDGGETKQNLDLRAFRLLSADCWMWKPSTCFVYIPASSCTGRILFHMSLLKPYWSTFSRRKVCFRILCPSFSCLHMCICAELKRVFAPFASTMLTPGMFSLMSNIFLSVPAFLP